MHPRVISVLGSFAALFVLSSGALADRFSWELAAGVSESTLYTSNEIDRASLTAKYYFDPVDDSDGPYALASFLNPASHLSLAFNREQQSSSPSMVGIARPINPISSLGTIGSAVIAPGVIPDGLFGNLQDYGLRGRYVLPRSKWYFGGGYSGIADSSLYPALQTLDSKQRELFVGRYFGPATAVELSSLSARTRYEQTMPVCVATLFCAELGLLGHRDEVDTTRLSVRHVLRGDRLTYALSGAIARTSGDGLEYAPLVDGAGPPASLAGGGVVLLQQTAELNWDDYEIYSVAGEIFPTPKIGVRAGYSRVDGARFLDHAYNVGVSWFLRRNIGLELSYARQDPKGPVPTASDAVGLRVVGRW